MGSSEICIFHHRNRHLLISLLSLLLISSLTQVRFMAEGREIPKLVEATQKGIEEMKAWRMVRSQIGSRPPRCERRCSGCRQCEAVQVPIAPQVKMERRSHLSAAIAYSRGDDLSNYKPMCWKCKCGDLLFNP